ncbi:MAG: CHASE3 domain-containing protein [Ferruginibacter sp.]
MKKSLQLIMGLLLVLAIVLVAAFAFINYNNNKKTKTSNNWLVHTNKILYRSEKLISELKDAETGTRGFIISGDSVFLQPYFDAKNNIPANITALKELTGDNPVQQRRMDTLSGLSYSRLDICKAVQAFRRRNDYTTTGIIPLLQDGKKIMDQVREVTGRLQQEESRLLAIREKENIENVRNAEQDFFVFLGSVALLLITGLIAAKYLGFLRKTETTAMTQMDSKLIFFSKRLDDVIKGIADPFFALDKNFNFIFFNEAVQTRMAYGKGKLFGKNFFDVFPQYASNIMGNKIREVMHTGRTESFETYDDFLDQWQDVTIYLTSEGVSVYIKNADRRKDYEKELIATRQLLEETSEVALVGGWEVDMLENRVTWTAVTSLIHETDATFRPDLKNGLLFYKEGVNRDTIIKLVDDAVADGKTWDAELQIITAKGKEKWVRTKGRAVMEKGVCVRLLGTFQDIDEQKKMADHLKEEKRLLKTIIDNIPVNVYIKDMQSRKILVNKSEMEYAGASNERDILGKSDLDLYPGEYAAISIEEDKKVFATREALLHQETTSVRHDGKQTRFLTSKIPFMNEQDEVVGLIGISYNITEMGA